MTMPSPRPARIIVEVVTWTRSGVGGAPFRRGVREHIRTAELEVPAGSVLTTVTLRVAGQRDPIALIDFRPPIVDDDDEEDTPQ